MKTTSAFEAAVLYAATDTSFIVRGINGGEPCDIVNYLSSHPGCDREVLEGKGQYDLAEYHYKIYQLLRDYEKSSQNFDFANSPKSYYLETVKDKFRKRYAEAFQEVVSCFHGLNVMKPVEDIRRLMDSLVHNEDSGYRGLKNDEATKDCLGHASLVIGRRRYQGKCQFLIRNTWGTACQKYSKDWDCDHGNVWLDSDEVAANVVYVSTLRGFP